jgi:CDP-diacylglycerol--glycerol-3-phosphate 3-phosphatidyltransferase
MQDFKELGRKYFVRPVAGFFIILKIHPNAITLVSLAFAIGAFFFYKAGGFWIGAIFFFVSSICDTFDGEIARLTDRVSKLGGFLDSTIDRVNEFAVYLGLFCHYYSRQSYVLIWILLALFGSMMVSYTRARAEGLGISPQVGIFERMVRLTLLIGGSFFGPSVMVYILAILAVGTFQTAVHRIIYVYVKTRDVEESKPQDR